MARRPTTQLTEPSILRDMIGRGVAFRDLRQNISGNKKMTTDTQACALSSEKMHSLSFVPATSKEQQGFIAQYKENVPMTM